MTPPKLLTLAGTLSAPATIHYIGRETRADAALQPWDASEPLPWLIEAWGSDAELLAALHAGDRVTIQATATAEPTAPGGCLFLVQSLRVW